MNYPLPVVASHSFSLSFSFFNFPSKAFMFHTTLDFLFSLKAQTTLVAKIETFDIFVVS